MDEPATSLRSIVAPSLLAGDFACLASESQRVLDAGADWLHVDVMDGHFVDNLTIGAPVVKSLRQHTDAFLDCHLMVSHPARWLRDFADAGASQFVFHVEAVDPRWDDFGGPGGEEDRRNMRKNLDEHSFPSELSETDRQILLSAEPESRACLALLLSCRRLGMRTGLAIRPKTPALSIAPYVSYLDTVLVMTVEPGFGGQKFMHDMVEKVSDVRTLAPLADVGVDGGMNPENTLLTSAAGSNYVVAGSSVFRDQNPSSVIDALRKSIETHLKL